MNAALDIFVRWVIRPKMKELWHPKNSGEKVTVTRTWVGRIYKPVEFATLSEAMTHGSPWKGMYDNEQCPVCGYYCLGKGGIGCIDKPKLCGHDI